MDEELRAKHATKLQRPAAQAFVNVSDLKSEVKKM
jgi:hypothetical protein